jgi:hypothetical protein
MRCGLRTTNITWELSTGRTITLRNPELVRKQSAYARKIIQETSAYDNVYHEICNEPGGGLPGHASAADVDAARYLRRSSLFTR